MGFMRYALADKGFANKNEWHGDKEADEQDSLAIWENIGWHILERKLFLKLIMVLTACELRAKLILFVLL